MPFEVVKPRRPQLSVRREPLVDHAQRFRADAVEASLGIWSNRDEARVAQDAKMLGHGGLADGQLGDEIAHRTLPLPEKIEDAPAIRLREDVERCHRLYITTQIYIWSGN